MRGFLGFLLGIVLGGVGVYFYMNERLNRAIEAMEQAEAEPAQAEEDQSEEEALKRIRKPTEHAPPVSTASARAGADESENGGLAPAGPAVAERGGAAIPDAVPLAGDTRARPALASHNPTD